MSVRPASGLLETASAAAKQRAAKAVQQSIGTTSSSSTTPSGGRGRQSRDTDTRLGEKTQQARQKEREEGGSGEHTPLAVASLGVEDSICSEEVDEAGGLPLPPRAQVGRIPQGFLCKGACPRQLPLLHACGLPSQAATPRPTALLTCLPSTTLFTSPPLTFNHPSPFSTTSTGAGFHGAAPLVRCCTPGCLRPDARGDNLVQQPASPFASRALPP